VKSTKESVLQGMTKKKKSNPRYQKMLLVWYKKKDILDTLHSRGDVLSKHMRKRIIALIRRRLENLKQPTITIRIQVRIATPNSSSIRPAVAVTYSGATGGGTLGGTALPAHAASLKDFLATVEEHVELGVANDAALSRCRARHHLDVLTLKLEQLCRHLRNRLSSLASLGTATDRYFELSW
jgi:hypothetical protein